MFSREYEFAAGGSNREAVDGFAAIAAALDQGIDTNAVRGGGIVDAIAIALGWLVLVAVIFYPALQLAAIATCAAFMCMKSFVRCVLGASMARREPQFAR
jgi:hypothetical protein